MNILSWSHGRLRARVALLSVALGLAMGVHAIAPSHAGAKYIDCSTDEQLCEGGGTGGGGDTGSGDTGSGGDTGWGDTGSGGDTGWGDTGSGGDTGWGDTGSGDDSGSADDTGSSDGTGSDPGGDSADPGDQQGDSDGGAPGSGMGATVDPTDPMPTEEEIPEADAISGADSRTINWSVCGAELLTFLRAPGGTDSEELAAVAYDSCLHRAAGTTITGSADPHGGHSPTGPVAIAAPTTVASAHQATQAPTQVRSATFQARAATQAAMRGAFKAREQAPVPAARHAASHRKAPRSKRHTAKHRG
jgi:hypothetical protein